MTPYALFIKESKYCTWQITHVVLSVPYNKLSEILLCEYSVKRWVDLHNVEDYCFNAKKEFINPYEMKRIFASTLVLALDSIGYRFIKNSEEIISD